MVENCTQNVPVCSCTTGVCLSVYTFVSQSFYASMNVVSLMSCVGMLSRIITSGAIFQKSLQLDQKKMGKLTISKVLNLAAADAGSLDFVSTCAAFLSFSCLCVFILICPMLTSMCLNLQAEGDSLLCVRSIYISTY